MEFEIDFFHDRTLLFIDYWYETDHGGELIPKIFCTLFRHHKELLYKLIQEIVWGQFYITLEMMKLIASDENFPPIKNYWYDEDEIVIILRNFDGVEFTRLSKFMKMSLSVQIVDEIQSDHHLAGFTNTHIFDGKILIGLYNNKNLSVDAIRDYSSRK